MKQNNRGEKSDRHNTATTRDMKKLLIFLGENGECMRATIRKKLGLNPQKINDGLIFLKRLRVVRERKDFKGTKMYSLTYDTN